VPKSFFSLLNRSAPINFWFVPEHILMWDISNQKLGKNNLKKVRDQILLRADF